jgi:hypothetical protein
MDVAPDPTIGWGLKQPELAECGLCQQVPPDREIGWGLKNIHASVTRTSVIIVAPRIGLRLKLDDFRG